jgi:hypothetical protein
MTAYRDTSGSVIDESGTKSHWGKTVLAEGGRKVQGVRINCPADQAERKEADMVAVSVPGTHPLFNIEGDDPLEISELCGHCWVTKGYSPGAGSVIAVNVANGPGLESPVARLLGLHTMVQDGKWVWCKGPSDGAPTGSILVVDRNRKDLDVSEVRTMCACIE